MREGARVPAPGDEEDPEEGLRALPEEDVARGRGPRPSLLGLALRERPTEREDGPAPPGDGRVGNVPVDHPPRGDHALAGDLEGPGREARGEDPLPVGRRRAGQERSDDGRFGPGQRADHRCPEPEADPSSGGPDPSRAIALGQVGA